MGWALRDAGVPRARERGGAGPRRAVGRRARRHAPPRTRIPRPRSGTCREDDAVLLMTPRPRRLPGGPRARRAHRRRDTSTVDRSTSRCFATRSYRRATATGTLPATWSRTAGTCTSPPASARPACRCAPARAARGAGAAAHSARAQDSSRVTCSSASPVAGSVADQQRRARPGGRPRLAARVERVVDPRERRARGPAHDSIAPSFQCRAGGSIDCQEREVGPAAGQPEQAREVLLGALLPARAPGALERRRKARRGSAACVGRQEVGYAVDGGRRPGRQGARLAKPKRDTTPSTSTSSRGRAAATSHDPRR